MEQVARNDNQYILLVVIGLVGSNIQVFRLLYDFVSLMVSNRGPNPLFCATYFFLFERGTKNIHLPPYWMWPNRHYQSLDFWHIKHRFGNKRLFRFSIHSCRRNSWLPWIFSICMEFADVGPHFIPLQILYENLPFFSQLGGEWRLCNNAIVLTKYHIPWGVVKDPKKFDYRT